MSNPNKDDVSNKLYLFGVDLISLIDDRSYVESYGLSMQVVLLRTPKLAKSYAKASAFNVGRSLQTEALAKVLPYLLNQLTLRSQAFHRGKKDHS